MRLVSSRCHRGRWCCSLRRSFACGDEGPRLPAEVRVTEGDGQIAPVGTLLPQPIAMTVLNADGSPAEGVTVEWQTDGDGSVLAPDLRTDASGVGQRALAAGDERG